MVERGYEEVAKARFIAAQVLGQPIYTRQFHIGKGIYKTDLNCDFIIYHPILHPQGLVIECKWQEVGGTTDEKYPYFILNIQQCYPVEVEVIVLLAGGGYRQAAADWLKGQVGNNLKHVFGMEEFQKWVNKGGL